MCKFAQCYFPMSTLYSDCTPCVSLRDKIPNYDLITQIVWMDIDSLVLTESDRATVITRFEQIMERALIPTILVQLCSNPINSLISNWKVISVMWFDDPLFSIILNRDTNTSDQNMGFVIPVLESIKTSLEHTYFSTRTFEQLVWGLESSL